jgi:hypothetical protein
MKLGPKMAFMLRAYLLTDEESAAEHERLKALSSRDAPRAPSLAELVAAMIRAAGQTLHSQSQKDKCRVRIITTLARSECRSSRPSGSARPR